MAYYAPIMKSRLRIRGVFALPLALALTALASLAYALAHTSTAETTCPTGVDLIHCFHAVHDTTLIVVAVVLGVVSAGLLFGLLLLRRT
jgi:hypothetical protein